ncbi:MAG TPA: alpha/beta fold hydrolase [Pyrinomonadaceae bacterium]|nr:alpha/beta fold hydrolase [Pyrinomonadaceae bacterium]
MKLEIISREPEVKRFETPLLFVHGTGHGAWCWDENFLPYFAEKGFGSHAVSLRGHGGSEGREKLKWSSIADYVSDVSQAASQLPAKPVVIGHSLGGLVVQKYLERHEAPAGILIAPSPSEGMFWSGLKIQLLNPLLMVKVAVRQDYAVMFSTPKLARKFLFSADADERKVAEYVGRFGGESYRAALEMIYNLPRPRKIKTPLLVVGARDDAIIAPKKIEKTARAFKADCEIFPNTAHDMMLERGWQKVADFMLGWLGKRVK